MRNKTILIGLIMILSNITILSQTYPSADTLETFFKKQIKKNTGLSYAYYGLASINFNRGDYKTAAKYAAKNLQKKNNFDTLCALLYARSLELSGRLGKAEKAYKKFNKLYPDNSWIGYYYGFYLYKVREYSQAEQVLERILQINPYLTDAHYLLGYSMIEYKNNPECIKAFVFGLMTDNDTLRSVAIIRLLDFYIKGQYDSLRFSYFEKRLALKNINDLLLPYWKGLNYFYQNFKPIQWTNFITENIAKKSQPSLYSRFFTNLNKEILAETLAYFALRNIEVAEIKAWYRANNTFLNQLANFLEDNLNKPF